MDRGEESYLYNEQAYQDIAVVEKRRTAVVAVLCTVVVGCNLRQEGAR